MTKKSGSHKLQRDRRIKALEARQADKTHKPSQKFVKGRGWKHQ